MTWHWRLTAGVWRLRGQSVAPARLHLLRPGNGAREGGGEILRRLEGQLDGSSRAGPQVRVHEVDRDRVLEQGVVRVVVRHHRARDGEPALLSPPRALRPDDLNYGCAHT